MTLMTRRFWTDTCDLLGAALGLMAIGGVGFVVALLWARWFILAAVAVWLLWKWST